MTAASSLGTAIKRARERRRWTQRDLADKLGVDIKSVSNWETGRTSPKNSIGALEDVLGISLGDETQPAGRWGPGDVWEGRPLDEWEAAVLNDRELPADEGPLLIRESRAVRAAYSGPSGTPGTGRSAGRRDLRRGREAG
jgi:transcriptional regulator with XRE-family HTH domain